jgi:hypothetical protein
MATGTYDANGIYQYGEDDNIATFSGLLNLGQASVSTVVGDLKQNRTIANLLLNSNFAINQRAYVSGTSLASGAYGFDRWKSTTTSSSMAFTAAPQGQLVTINSGGSFAQIVERSNVPAGTYTLSWSGTSTARIYNSGSTAPAYAASPITRTLDGLQNVVVEFTAAGATKTLQKVQLEPGVVATTWKSAMPTYQAELVACQRYYWRNLNPGYFAQASYWGGTQFYATLQFPVVMRTTPSAASSAASAYSILGNGANTACSTATFVGSSQSSAYINGTCTAGTTGSSGTIFGNVAGTYFAFDAEL